MKIYDVYQEPTEEEISTCKCDVCGAIGKLMLRKGKQFKRWYFKCPNNHFSEVRKEIDDIFQLGDRIRVYHVPFGKNSKIDLSTYNEGIIINKEKGIINYKLNMKIDKAVYKNKLIMKSSWLYGHVIEGISSDDNALELLTPQMRVIV